MTAPAAPPGVLADYQEQLAGMDETSFIGVMLYYEFRQPKVTREYLEQAFMDLGLDERYLPPPIKSVDAYRRATGQAARHRYSTSPDRHIELMVRDVVTDHDHVVRSIVREVRDARGRKLEYDQIAEAVYYRQTKRGGGSSLRFSQLNNVNLSGGEQGELNGFIERMHEDFKFYSVHYHTQAIRDMIRNYVESLNAISIRSTGAVYFVHRSRWDTITRLVTLVNDRIGAGCRIHVMPLIDTTYQRDMLSEAYQDEVERSVDKLLGRIGRLNEEAKGSKVPPSKYAAIQSEWQDLSDRSAEYGRVFSARQGRSAEALEMALDAVMEMATRIDHGGK